MTQTKLIFTVMLAEYFHNIHHQNSEELWKNSVDVGYIFAILKVNSRLNDLSSTKN